MRNMQISVSVYVHTKHVWLAVELMLIARRFSSMDSGPLTEFGWKGVRFFLNFYSSKYSWIASHFVYRSGICELKC